MSSKKTKTSPLLEVQNLSVNFTNGDDIFPAVKDISFDIKTGETVALVGESGSGKSVSALSIMRLLSPAASHGQGSSITFEEQELLSKSESDMRSLRGQDISMIFQEPQTALNPLHTIEKQISEMLTLHQKMNRKKAQTRVRELLDLVGLSQLKDRLDAYPHQLSGGQRQRVMIAMALANNPKLLIADEPTTALDVTIQAQILELLHGLKTRLNMALLIITHDLTIVEKISDRVCVMQHGEIVEQGDTAKIFEKPKHAYTKMLLGAQPKSTASKRLPKAPVTLETDTLKIHFPKAKNFWGQTTNWVKAVDGISLTLREKQTLGIVGESGSGKSTLGMGILRLLRSQGAINFKGQNIASLPARKLKPLRKDIQIVFQDPYGSLSPRMTVAQIIGEGLEIHSPHLSKSERDAKIIEALKDVDLNPETRHRYPHEFSGGQRQRISIARAMVLRPKLVILDEPTSALDLTVQSQIVDLLRDLQEKYSLSYIFISHDLRVVRALAHDLIVMKNGKVVESGAAKTIFDKPQEPYTKQLLNAALNLKAS